MRTLCSLIAFFLITSLTGQQGGYLLKHHAPNLSNIDNTSFEIVNDAKGRICVANKSGILKYDGEAWDFYRTPSTSLSMAIDTNDVVYVGCIGSVGTIDLNGRAFGYQPIFETEGTKDLFLETLHQDHHIYFMGGKNLVVYDIANEAVRHFEGSFANLYQLGGAVYVNTEEGGTFQVADTLAPVAHKVNVAFTDTRGTNPELIIDYQGKLWSYASDAFSLSPFNKLIAERGYELQEVRWINDSLFVAATFESGLLFFDINKPKEVVVTDYHSGLPDNEIFALHADDANGVWAAHEFGITQISPLFPASSYSYFQGLDGNLTSVAYLDDRLWLTSSQGVFYFEEDTVYENKVYYEVVQKRKRQAATQQASSTPKEQPGLKRLFGKKKRAKSGSSEKKGLFKSISSIFEGNGAIAKVKGKLDKNSKYVRKVKRVPVDVKFSFERIAGSSGKFLSVTKYKDKLLGIGTTGIYEISDNEAQSIIEENIQAFALTSDDRLVISTSNLEIKFYTLMEEVWVEQINVDTEDIILNIAEASDGHLWMAGASQLYKTSATDTSLALINSYPIDNNYLDNVDLVEPRWPASLHSFTGLLLLR